MPLCLLQLDSPRCCSRVGLDEQYDRLCIPLSVAGDSHSLALKPLCLFIVHLSLTNLAYEGINQMLGFN